jgi:hypothetical protein
MNDSVIAYAGVSSLLEVLTWYPKVAFPSPREGWAKVQDLRQWAPLFR